ncbi:MAG: hypothetical protein KatS3mg097_659 [Candidatus Parcubacteria bacterium]|nr:MAG: hypothetical protein KatS3mg097_659 [Candidatus Parcubacteria bacterium]
MYLVILISSFSGALVAYHIYYHKRQKKPLVCPLKADCENVVHSNYSKFLGIDLEKLGIFYYSLIFISYLIYQISGFDYLIFDFVLFSLSLLAFLFSIYLTFIQVLKIRKFCSWCLVSAFLSSLIFLNSYFLYRESIVFMAKMLRDITVFVHALSGGVGLGVVLVVDYLFFKFLKDRKIDQREKEVLDHLSDFVWLVLGLIIVSGLFIYFSDMEKYHNSVKFQFKMIAVSILIINGFLMNLFISPKLIDLDLKNLSSYKEKMAIIMGTISFMSWFLSFCFRKN